MKIAAIRGIADLIKESELNEDYIVPSVFNEDVCSAVADAVKSVEMELSMVNSI